MSHSLVICSDQTVRAWGDGVDGQLGNGANLPSNVPVQVVGQAGALALAAGRYHSLGLKEDGTVWAWGGNPHGQLGNGTNVSSNIP